MGRSGIVDLYLMPAYDDVATLLHDAHGWQLRDRYSGSPSIETISDADPEPLTKESLRDVLERLVRDVG